MNANKKSLFICISYDVRFGIRTFNCGTKYREIFQKRFSTYICPTYKGENSYEMEPVASGENLITASGVAPLEFAVEVLKTLDVFAPDTLHSWYELNKTHEPEHCFQLMNSLNS